MDTISKTKINQLSSISKQATTLPVLWSPAVYRSDVVLEYEKPTPAGESRKSIFATAEHKRKIKKKKKKTCEYNLLYLNLKQKLSHYNSGFIPYIWR